MGVGLDEHHALWYSKLVILLDLCACSAFPWLARLAAADERMPSWPQLVGVGDGQEALYVSPPPELDLSRTRVKFGGVSDYKPALFAPPDFTPQFSCVHDKLTKCLKYLRKNSTNFRILLSTFFLRGKNISLHECFRFTGYTQKIQGHIFVPHAQEWGK